LDLRTCEDVQDIRDSASLICRLGDRTVNVPLLADLGGNDDSTPWMKSQTLVFP
jgi:hypothetical protein